MLSGNGMSSNDTQSLAIDVCDDTEREYQRDGDGLKVVTVVANPMDALKPRSVAKLSAVAAMPNYA